MISRRDGNSRLLSPDHKRQGERIYHEANTASQDEHAADAHAIEPRRDRKGASYADGVSEERNDHKGLCNKLEKVS